MDGRIIRQARQLNLPRVGKIKIGSKNERGLPQSQDFFSATGAYYKLFEAEYGKTPSLIQIVFPSDETEKVCNEMYEYRDNSGKLCAYGNGQDFYVWNGQEYILFTRDENPQIMQQVSKRYPSKKGWQITLTLTFIIPRVRGVAGVWSLTTKGAASTIPAICDTFDFVKSQKGYVKGLIFDLCVSFATSQKPGQNSRYPVINLVLNESDENLKTIKGVLEQKK